MSQVQRDHLAAVIRAWRDGSGLLERSAASAGLEERPVEILLERLRSHTTMTALAEAYLADAGWPVELPWPSGVDRGRWQSAVVATAYWRRYQELLTRATEQSSGQASVPAVSSPERPSDALGPEFGHLELLYTVRLWQRGPLRLRALPPDRRARYEPLVDTVYARLACCDSVRALAARYYGDGDWVLEFARASLLPMGEPISNIGWVQDAACWRRYQELLDGSPVRQRPSVRRPEFAIWLANQMARRRISVAELAHRLGTLEAVVWSWLHAADAPGEEHARRLAGAFGLAESQMPRVSEAAH